MNRIKKKFFFFFSKTGTFFFSVICRGLEKTAHVVFSKSSPSYSVGVSISAFHAGDTGSNPVRKEFFFSKLGGCGFESRMAFFDGPLAQWLARRAFTLVLANFFFLQAGTRNGKVFS